MAKTLKCEYEIIYRSISHFFFLKKSFFFKINKKYILGQKKEVEQRIKERTLRQI